MKKIIVSTAFLVVIGVGGVFAYNQTEEPKKETVEEVKVQEEKSQVASAKEEEVEKPSTENAPTERTVDLGPDKPWERMTPTDIMGQQNNGETVYLLSDAEDLENSILAFAKGTFKDLDSSANTFGQSKEQISKSWAQYIKAFAAGVSKDYDNLAYFNKLHQVQLALESQDYESIPGLINEAKELR